MKAKLTIFEAMQDMLLKLSGLEEKVLQLVEKVEYLKKENLMLIEENVSLKQVVEKYRVGTAGVRENFKDRRDGTVIHMQTQSEHLRRELDKYIVEIDKCIELINNM